MSTYDDPEPLTEEKAGEAKAAAFEPGAPTGQWRADLWANVPAAIAWANRPPLSLPGTIVFNIRDNGQVWTYTFL